MPVHSIYLSKLTAEQRLDLINRLHDRQSGVCFLCDTPIDMEVHKGALEIDHVIPIAVKGPDDPSNFALVHGNCNAKKGASDLRVARLLNIFETLQEEARGKGDRGPNLSHVLGRFGGARANLRVKESPGKVNFALSAAGDDRVQELPLYEDPLSGMKYFFGLFPLEYLHHDDRINPRSIGSNLRGLIEEFQKQRPQLQVGLAWWTPDEDGTGPLRVFDGQHKAAAQILLGVKSLPLRVFVRPDTNVLLQANANAGDQLRQVAFDVAVKRHLGSTLYAERVRDYQSLKGLREDDFSFSESDLVTFFRGEHREVLRYILDAVRDGITHSPDNRLMQYVEWAGKEAIRPVAYSAVEKTFYSEFLYPKPLTTPISFRMEEGENPRQLEKLQMGRLMSLGADSFFANQWDPDRGGRKIEYQLQQGEAVPEPHFRAWRLGREEVLGVCVEWTRVVIENFYAWTGARVDRDKLLHQRFSEELWRRISAFLTSLRDLPCWVDKGLSRTLFGAKQNRDAWRTIFDTGKSPQGVRVLAEPLDLTKMIGNR